MLRRVARRRYVRISLGLPFAHFYPVADRPGVHEVCGARLGRREVEGKDDRVEITMERQSIVPRRRVVEDEARDQPTSKTVAPPQKVGEGVADSRQGGTAGRGYKYGHVRQMPV